MKRRLLIAEEALRDFHGHYFEYDHTVAEANRRAGVEVDVAVNAAAGPEVLEPLAATPVFRRTTWDGGYRGRGWRRWRDYLRHGARTWRDLRRFARGRPPWDLVFVPTATPHQLLAWRLWVALRGRRHGEQLVLFLRLGEASYRRDRPEPVFKEKARVAGRILRSFRGPIARGHVRLATDSDRIAAEFHALCGASLEVFPSPVASDAMAPETRPAGPVVLTSLGPARVEKGSLVLQQAIRRVFERDPDLPVRFVIQWPARPTEKALVRDPELAADPRVEYLDRPLDPDAYRRRLLESDAILLPYLRTRYAVRISGVAIEAATAGIPVIHTRDTWTEDAVRAYGCGLPVADEDPDDLAETIRAFAGDVDRWRARARARAALARAYHSPAKHLECLWDHPRWRGDRPG